jgi:hypothetical protein
MTYLKITNKLENHKGLQYQTGLIEDIIPFEPEGSCVPGGIYFSDEKNILTFLDYGEWIREVTIPSDAEMVQDSQGDKWRASKVILGERLSLSEVSTWEWLVSIGVDIHVHKEYPFRRSSEYGYLEIVKCLVSLGTDIHVFDDYALRNAAANGKLEIVKYLVSLGANIHIFNESTLMEAASHGHLDVVKYLVSVGADIHACNEYPLKSASEYGYLELVKYLVSVGANVHCNNDTALKLASDNKHLEVVAFLESCK